MYPRSKAAGCITSKRCISNFNHSDRYSAEAWLSAYFAANPNKPWTPGTQGQMRYGRVRAHGTTWTAEVYLASTY